MASTSPSSDGRPADAPLDRFIRYFEGLKREDLENIGDVYAEDVHFRDPFSDFTGLATLRRVFEGMFDNMSGYGLEVREAGMLSDDTAFVRWIMSGHVRVLGKDQWVVDGGSLIRFDGNGRVREHIDYWDAASQMYERLPVIGWVLKRIRRKLAMH